jgi:hypothetical protein
LAPTGGFPARPLGPIHLTSHESGVPTTLTLRVRRSGPDSFTISARASDVPTEFIASKPHIDFTGSLKLLQEEVRHRSLPRSDTTTSLRSPGFWRDRIESIGIKLYNFLFTSEISLFIEKQLQNSKRLPLKIRLVATDLDIVLLPWEMLYDRARRQFLTLDQFIHFARSFGGGVGSGSMSIEANVHPPQLPSDVHTLIIHGVTARSRLSANAVDADGAQYVLQRAVEPLAGLVRATFALSHTPQELVKDLAREVTRWGRVDVIDFRAAAGYDEERGAGYILMEGESSSDSLRLYPDTLCAILGRPGPMIKLVLLDLLGNFRASFDFAQILFRLDHQGL